jgi:hypothetical protein
LLDPFLKDWPDTGKLILIVGYLSTEPGYLQVAFGKDRKQAGKLGITLG